jgi:Fe2+ transport system protein B
VILGISIILWFLTAYPKHSDPEASAAAQIEGSFAGSAGKLIEPAIEPLGFDWQIGIGLIASFAAREVFVSSMAVVPRRGGARVRRSRSWRSGCTRRSARTPARRWRCSRPR